MNPNNRLKGIIASRGLSQRKVAKKLGVSTNTFYSKINKGVFTNVEILKLMDILQIDDPIPIFFTSEVTCGVTNDA